MRLRPFLLILLPLLPAGVGPAAPSTLGPDHVVIVYNQKHPESKKVAEAYAAARAIAPEAMIGLDCSLAESITRKEFRDTIQEPLRREFSSRNWWQLARGDIGIVAVEPKKRVLALIHGMPLRIHRDAAEAAGKNPREMINEASVDSELMLLGLFDAPIASALNNPYFKKNEDFATFKEPAMYLVARLDGPDAATATRLATEAVAVEKAGGPWGRTVLDLAGKGGAYQIGDDWIARVFNQAWDAGMPAQIDRHPWTLPDYYPLSDCVVYFGWYEGHANGFLLDPAFRFRRGAIAAHLHSFSATSIRTTDKFWVGPILSKGALATVGNVWEPYLEMTHHFDQFHAALLEGYTLAEAGATSIPVLSWMNIVVGDPLYRPFAGRRTIADQPAAEPGDNAPWMAVRVAMARWKDNPREAAEQLRAAGRRTRAGILMESAGLLEYKLDRQVQAQKDFEEAMTLYPKKADQLRCRLHAVESLLARQQKVFAVKMLAGAEEEFRDIIPVKAATQHRTRLDPPPAPPPAKPAAP